MNLKDIDNPVLFDWYWNEKYAKYTEKCDICDRKIYQWEDYYKFYCDIICENCLYEYSKRFLVNKNTLDK